MIKESWQTVRTEVAALVERHADGADPFSLETIAQSNDVISELSANWPAPTVGKGYWSTVILMWGELLQVEIFDDHLEVYHSVDSGMNIQHFHHQPGKPLPHDFLTAIAVIQNNSS